MRLHYLHRNNQLPTVFYFASIFCIIIQQLKSYNQILIRFDVFLPWNEDWMLWQNLFASLLQIALYTALPSIKFHDFKSSKMTYQVLHGWPLLHCPIKSKLRHWLMQSSLWVTCPSILVSFISVILYVVLFPNTCRQNPYLICQKSLHHKSILTLLGHYF